jgi:phage tail-like protein
MDVNGLPFRLVAGKSDFGLSEGAVGMNVAEHLALSERTFHLRLASEQSPPQLSENETFAREMITHPSPVADKLGGYAWWNNNERRIEASGFVDGSIEIKLEAGSGLGTPSDMALGRDDVLYIARGGAVIWHDLRSRWPDLEVVHKRLKADLLAPAPKSGAWAFDRTNRRLMRVKGTPLRFAEFREPDESGFVRTQSNRDPPRLWSVPRSGIDGRFDAVALACSTNGRLALLAWESGSDAALFIFTDDGFAEHGRLQGLRFPFGLAWIDDDLVAVIGSDGAAPARQAYAYNVGGAHVAGRKLNPDGRIRRLLQPWAGGFCNALGPVPHYLQAAADNEAPTAVLALHPISGAQYAREGKVLVGPLDSGVAGCIWHRIYAEAALADGSAIDLQLRASDDRTSPGLPTGLADPDWALHRILPHRSDDTPSGTPVAAWLPAQSEIPNAPALLDCANRPDKAGLFTLLLQHNGRKVRRIVGRYLWINLTLRGDSQCSPELAALRVYAGRHSWRDNYLPAFYGEALSGSDADAPGPATRHDFMERLLHAHEGPLTEIEGRISASWQLTDPVVAPEPALPWIGQWIGIQAMNGEKTSRMRHRLMAAPYTAALNGTVGGLMAALELATGGRMISGGRISPNQPAGPGQLVIARSGDVAVRGLILAAHSDGGCVFLTGGSVTKGDIVVVEGFRLRRTFATILGADLADEDDPLTLGMASSGNSFVGDTLILGDTAREELLALYRPEIDAVRGDTEAVTAFYMRLAWRVMVLIRGVTDSSEFKRLSDIVAAEVPAHVEPLVCHAHNPLIVGAASLVGVDTYLAEPEPFHRVQLGETVVGEGDFIAGSGALDSRADGPVPRAPTARADGPAEVWVGNSFTLSALASRAAERARLERYIWMWDEET